MSAVSVYTTYVTRSLALFMFSILLLFLFDEQKSVQRSAIALSRQFPAKGDPLGRPYIVDKWRRLSG